MEAGFVLSSHHYQYDSPTHHFVIVRQDFADGISILWGLASLVFKSAKERSITMKVNPLHLLTVFLTLLTGCWMTACVGTTDFLTAAVLPRAQCLVKVKMDHDSNYIIRVYLYNVIRNNDLKPARSAYVVWMESDRGITKNIGKLKYSANIFSNTSKSTFRPASPLKPARRFITAENDPDIQFSNNEIVFSTSKFLD